MNTSSKKSTKASVKKAAKKKPARTSAKPKLLSGGNPQIAKGDGEAPVQEYLEAMPGWKKEVGHKLDQLITNAVPKVQKAVRWNSPFYGVSGKGWFLSFHCFNKYIKVTFLRGTKLDPLPPVESKDPNTRYYHVFENEPMDEKQFVKWVKQASKQPGDPLF